jgi:hypothetical protein
MDHESSTHAYYGRPVMPSAATSLTPSPNRVGTPNTDRSRNPFSEGDAASPRPGDTNPFASPNASRPASSYGSSSALGQRNDGPRYFRSRKVGKGEVERPWLEKKHPKEKWVTIIPLIGILIGLGISGFLIYDGYSSVVQHTYCPVLDDDFSGGLNSDIWRKEVEVGGFGYGFPFTDSTMSRQEVLTHVVMASSPIQREETKMYSSRMAT